MTSPKGIYVHTHWSYRHPYAARTWSLQDWGGLIDALDRIGYTLLQIWPMIDTMPVPPTPSDREHLGKIRNVIRLAHDRGFTVVIGAGANVAANERARSFSFSSRPYFQAERLVDPSDPSAVRRLIDHRRQLLEPLKEADGFWILDCDPGGFPGATSSQLVSLFLAHRRLLDSLRPGIELVYWMWAGWEKTGFEESWQNSAQDAWREVIHGLLREAPEPWRVNACWPGHFRTLEEQNQLHRALYFPYNALEFEPSFPLTNWYPGPEDAMPAALSRVPAEHHPRGVMANAQSHCLQLPHLYLFSHLAGGGSPDSIDLPRFAGRLLPKVAEELCGGWIALNGDDPQRMREAENALASVDSRRLESGELGGLLFGDPARLLEDLVLQLRAMAPLARIRRLLPQEKDPRTDLRAFAEAFRTWQRRHGFSDWARGPFIERLHHTLEPIIPGISTMPFDPRHGYTTRILHAVQGAARQP